MSSRSRAAAAIASWCSSAQSTLTSPDDLGPAGGRDPVVLGRGEQPAPVLLARHQAVDPLQLEAEVGLRAGFAERLALGVEGPAHPGPVGEGGDGHEQRRAP